MSQDLRPIPIPLKQRWHEFRVAYLPFLMFGVLVAIIGWMWGRYLQAESIIGEVQMVRANVLSTVACTVRDLKVTYLQAVTNGQELAVVAPLDSEQLNAEIAAAEADLRLMKARMDLDQTRNLDSYSRLRLDLLDQGFQRDVARIRLQQAEAELDRAKRLADAQLISRGVASAPSGFGLRNDFGYEVAVRDRDALKAEVASRETIVADLESNLQRLQASGNGRLNPSDAAVEQAIAARREQIERLQKPFALRAPIDGFISDVNRRPGEKVTAGQVILVVSAGKTDRIVAWVHQPVTVRPRAGDIVEVRRMGMGQVAFEATILEVGQQLEPVSPMLRSPTANPERIEVGLPLWVKSDRVRELIPGEPVLLRIIKTARSSTAN